MATYLIVGGSSGIGYQLATQLRRSGNRIYATYYRHKLDSDSPDLTFHYCNVLDDEIDLSYLPQVIDGLVYAPGSINLRPFQRISHDEFLLDYKLQVGGAVRIIKAVLPLLKASGNTSVVLFSTVAVQMGFPFHSQVAASKGAIEGLTRSLAAEFAPHIRVNCIAPSLTDTPLAAHLLGNDEKRTANALRHPLKKIGAASDIGGMAEFLLSEKSGWITGQIIHVDGGMSSIKT